MTGQSFLRASLVLLLTAAHVSGWAFEKNKPHHFAPAPLPFAAQGEVQILFAPRHDIEGALVKLIHSAHHTVQVAAYGFTSRPIAQALVEAYKRGVAVQVVLDHDRTVKERAAGRMRIAAQLLTQGVAVRTWQTTAQINGIMHHKFVVIDAASKSAVLMTGSYNFTFSARSRNAENVVILRNAPEAARSFAQEFSQLYANALPLK